jgi:hypothetical protein
MSANPATISKAQEFIGLLENVMDFVEGVSHFVPEGKYLQVMNVLGSLYKIKPDEPTPTTIRESLQAMLNTSPVYVEQARVLRYKPRLYRREQSDAEKLKSGLYEKCIRCDKVITKTYMRQHIHNNSCVAVKKTKKLTKDTTLLDTTRISKFITSINAFRYRAIHKKIKMYEVAINYFQAKGDLQYADVLRCKIDEIAVLVE